MAGGVVRGEPFILQDSAWDDFAWVNSSNTPYPVFNDVKAWRCANNIPEACN